MTPAERRAWQRWLDAGSGGEPLMVGVACPACRSTVAHVEGHDPRTGRTDLSCAMCGCPHYDVP